MKISDFLSPSEILLDVVATDKWQLLQDLAHKTASALDAPEALILTEILRREELGSTGTGGGVAVPHARIPGVAKPFGVLARLRQPVEFNAIDEKPVDLVFMLVLPSNGQNEQISTLACVARKLRDPKALIQLRQSRNTREAFEAFAG
jgi:nitrogen PTS system EIIA component